MHNTQRNYIIKQESGELWNFFYSNKNGILYKKFQDNRYSLSKLAVKDGTDNFTVMLTEDNKIALLYQDIYGNIVLSILHNNNWSSETLMKRKSGSMYSIFFDAVIIKDSIHIIYCIPDESTRKYALIHQTSHLGERLNQPIVVDILNSLYKTPFNLYANDNELFLIYKNLTDNWTLCYKSFSFESNKWSDINIIDNSKNTFKELSFTSNNKSTLLVYIKSEEKDNIFMYFLGNKLAKGPKLIYKSDKLDDCSVFIVYEQTWISWISENKISSGFSIDECKNFNFIENNTELKIPVKKTQFVSNDKELKLHLNLYDLFVDDSSDLNIHTVSELYPNILNNNAKLPILDKSPANNSITPMLQNMNVTMNEYYSKILVYEKKIADYEEEVKKLNSQLSKYTNSYEMLKRNNSEISFKYSKTLSENKRISSLLVEVQEQLISKQQRISSLEKQLISLQEVCLKLQKENIEIKESIEEMKSELQKIKEPFMKRFFGANQ